MKTLVKVEFFKYTGKWYDSFEFKTNIEVYEMEKIKLEALNKKQFITKMNFTIEVTSLNNVGWNKYLFCSDDNK